MASYTFDGSGRPVPVAPTNSTRNSNNITQLVVDEFPTKAIPIIFLPGILGSPLRRAANAPEIRRLYKPTWAWFPDYPINWVAGMFSNGRGYAQLTPAERKLLLDPNTTLALKPDAQDIESTLIKRISEQIPTYFSTNDGRFDIADQYSGETKTSSTSILSTQEALRRGWATVYWSGYGDLLCMLERGLRQITYSAPYEPGKTSPIMPVQNFLTELLHGEKDIFHRALEKFIPGLDPKTQKVNDYMQAIEPLLENCRNYHYPVFAVGYNWLQSNSVSADYVYERINEIKDYVQRQPQGNDKDQGDTPPAPGSGGLGWTCEDGVILVTHSMGGLVGRSLAKKHPDLIRGVVHGVQPCDGSATLYARMKGGWEGTAGLFLAEIGDELMPVLTQSPGATELSPNQNYQAGWLRIYDNTGRRWLDSFPKPQPSGKCDPYEEIYLQRDAWWKLGEPALMDPSANTSAKLDKAWSDYEKIVRSAQEFHQIIDGYYHPNTFMHYGNSKDYRTWGTITWDVAYYNTEKFTLNEEERGYLDSEEHNSVILYSRNSSYVDEDIVTEARSASHPIRGGQLGATQIDLSYKARRADRLIASMRLADTDGDGTVPFNSGNPWQAQGWQWGKDASDAVSMSSKVPEAVRYIFQFKEHPFEHGASYVAKNAQFVTLYSILNIIGKA